MNAHPVEERDALAAALRAASSQDMARELARRTCHLMEMALESQQLAHQTSELTVVAAMVDATNIQARVAADYAAAVRALSTEAELADNAEASCRGVRLAASRVMERYVRLKVAP